MRAKKACSEPRCPHLAPCPDHARKPWAGSARDRGLQTISGSRRQQRSRYVIDRADTVCALCGLPGSTEVDHLTPLAWGGADDLTNLQSVHRDCHEKKSQLERQQAHPGSPDAGAQAPMKAATLGVSDFAQVKAQGL
jgi:5-methylcytosine-specific restriction enzyme A